MLTSEQVEILSHTLTRAPGNRYAGDSPTMQELIGLGLMRSCGRVAWCPDEYFTITDKGRETMLEAGNG